MEKIEMWMIVFLCIFAFLVSFLLFPLVIRYARAHNIYDNPNVRKLQREPVPVMGGVAVYFGIISASIVGVFLFRYHILGYVLLAMSIMMIVGLVDDVKDVPANLRFILELVIVWLMMILSDNYIDDFHGVWNIGRVSFWWGMPLSIISGVGIINSINLMDGVDGYSSAFGIIACSILSIPLFVVGEIPMASFSLICSLALLPFFMHNVFGKTSKMFIGDSGTLMIGTALTAVIFRILSSNSPCSILEYSHNLCLFAFTLSVMSVPVFDTLRVMFARIINNKSPFEPDKTHLHHLFIEMGFSHIGTTFTILSANLFVVFCWWLSWKLNASISVQLYVVLLMGLFFTCGFYYFMKYQQKKDSAIYRFACHLGTLSHFERGRIWKWMTSTIDKLG
ncbi:MAG: undecaprenyl/decaprenyl-phosphate alpha-N-acetylglucosaminyl 1-phosphate transferase [Bacteroidales bacterium]|nr:undecaprenyl/decaprenyl-phosphate alpha-N-acetylglucosaminyl 1-phosphate transferase [Bacteroidales bacterium]